jgi:hypothetical protein
MKSGMKQECVFSRRYVEQSIYNVWHVTARLHLLLFPLSTEEPYVIVETDGE